MIQYGVYGLASIAIAMTIDIFGIATTRQIVFAEAVVATVLVMTLYIKMRKIDEVITVKEPVI